MQINILKNFKIMVKLYLTKVEIGCEYRKRQSLEGISQACTQAIQKCQKVAGTKESKTIIDQYNQCKAEADELGRSDEILQCPEDPSQLQGSCKKLVMKFLLKKVECDTKAETQPVQDFNQCTDQVGNVCPNAILESAHCSDKH